MRAREPKRSKTTETISVHAIAGTEVVFLGLDATPEAARGLLGFTIKRTEGTKEKWLGGGRTFRDGPVAGGGRGDSRSAPIQAFLWGDYEARPGTHYVYTVTPKYGTPKAMHDGPAVTVEVDTENPNDAQHGVFFNRGVAGSQAYSRKFGDYRRYYLINKRGQQQWQPYIRPDALPDRKAWEWLSRGLEEAMLEFIRQANGPRYSLRVAAYEFDYLPVLMEFAAALEAGADVRIIYHAKRTTRQEVRKGNPVKVEVLDPITQSAQAALRRIGIKKEENTTRWQGAFTERTHTTIAHNKFIVLLDGGEPVSVWTGSTNFTAGGIFGQSNVGHVIRDRAVAARYLEYWEKLKTDPPRKKASKVLTEMGIQDWNVHTQPDLSGPPAANSMTPIFSPRPTTAMLQWYADRMAEAKSSVHFTAAFGVSQQVAQKLLAQGASGGASSFQRYIMLESVPSKQSSSKRKDAARTKGRAGPLDYNDFKDQPCNRIAWGEVLRRRGLPGQGDTLLEESLAGLNINVDYLHTKYLLIDPLTDDPVVITGSANFSDNSTTMNDENMLVIRGDTRVADIFLTEFMRLFNHFYYRNQFNRLSKKAAEGAVYLAHDDSWTAPYYAPGTQEHRERLLFS
jgi:phosphatidylserine/phosphatidylglycerophosphate/cardiolipin synthase-like enzyme